MLLATIWGRERDFVKVEDRGVQIRPLRRKSVSVDVCSRGSSGRVYLVYRIMKAIFSVVMASAAMMRSPSFSRSAESRTTMKLPFSRRW